MTLAHDIVTTLTERNQTISCAESLTAGLLVASLVEAPGASEAVAGGVVTYTAQSKINVLGVNPDVIEQSGTVNAEVAEEMAVRVRDLFGSDFAISTTGVAGPGPFEGRQSGTVFIGLATSTGVESLDLHLAGGRAEVRRQSVEHALERMWAILSA